MKNIDLDSLKMAFLLAKDNQLNVKTTGCYCGRVYIVFTEKFRTNGEFYKKIRSVCNFRILNINNSALKSIYIGYDNATGNELSFANSLQLELSKIGINCYVETQED